MKFLVSALALALITATASAKPMMKYTSPPPGAVVQDVVVYLSGEGMSSRWHGDFNGDGRSDFLLQNGQQLAYQWYLSIYEPTGNGWKLASRWPGNNRSPLSKVTKAHGAELYFPMQSLKIVGGAELEQPAVQDAVVQIHEAAADCGSSTVAIIGLTKKYQPTIRTSVRNGCDLQASIVKYGQMQAVQLTGPYYGPKAAMCCPTKPKATARLTYSGQIRGWNVTPNYFKLK